MQNVLQNSNSQTLVVPPKNSAQKEQTPTKKSSMNILELKYAGPKLQSPTNFQPAITKKPSHRISPRLPKVAHLPLLIFSLIGYSVMAYIFIKVSPTSIEHVLLPNSYLPLLAVFFFSNLCLFSFLLNNTRRGFLIALILSIYLFLRLQQLLTLPIALFIFLPAVLYEVTMLFLEKAK